MKERRGALFAESIGDQYAVCAALDHFLDLSEQFNKEGTGYRGDHLAIKRIHRRVSSHILGFEQYSPKGEDGSHYEQMAFNPDHTQIILSALGLAATTSKDPVLVAYTQGVLTECVESLNASQRAS